MNPHTITIREGKVGRTFPSYEIEIREDGHERPLRMVLSRYVPLAEVLAKLEPVLQIGAVAELARRDAEILAAPEPAHIEEITEEELLRRAEEADKN